MKTLIQDLRYALRWLSKNPGFTAVAVLTLGLGIGANAAIFSFVRGVLLRPLPYANPERVVQVWERTERDGRVQSTVPLSNPNFRDYRERSRSFESMSAYSDWTFNLTGRGTPEQVSGALVSATFLRVLGVRPLAGRTFDADEDRPGRDGVVVISQRLWERRFGSDPRAIGSALTLNSRSFVVIGVVPSGLPLYDLASGCEVYAPLSLGFSLESRGAHWLGAIGRLREGVSLPAARSELAGIAATLAREYPDTNVGFSTNLLPASEQIVGAVRPALLMMLGAVALVLLIAAANVANMLLARASARSREIAVRSALGAGRGRILRQLLTESAVLALAGAAFGIVVAFWCVDGLRALAPGDLPRLEEVRVDGAVAGFAVGASLLSTLVFGLVPAWSLSRGALGESLKDSGARSTGAHGVALRDTLVVAELAMSLVLVTGAGLLLRSLQKLENEDLGFSRGGMLTFQLQLPTSRYGKDADAGAFHERLLERLRGLPGVTAAETIMGLPLTSDRVARLAFAREGVPRDPAHPMIARFNAVSPGLFSLLHVPVVRGRGLSREDSLTRPKVALVNEALARRYFPGEEPLGRRLALTGDPKPEDWTTIVGVVRNFRDSSAAAEPEPQIYTPYVQNTSNGFFVLLRTDRGGAGLMSEVRRRVAGIDPEQPIYSVHTFDELVSFSFGQPRFRTTLLGGFGLLALLLAAVGIYGVMAYSVAQRTREIGIRMALGAARGDVLRLVLRQVFRLSALAVAAGLVGALALSRALASLLYGVRPADPATFAGVSILLLGVAALAAYVPARRAARVDPTIALRME